MLQTADAPCRSSHVDEVRNGRSVPERGTVVKARLLDQAVYGGHQARRSYFPPARTCMGPGLLAAGGGNWDNKPAMQGSAVAGAEDSRLRGIGFCSPRYAYVLSDRTATRDQLSIIVQEATVRKA